MPRSARTKSGRKVDKNTADGGQKKEERENPFAFKIINEAQTKSLLEVEVEEVEKQVAEILKLPNHSTDLLQSSQLDYYVGCFWWCKEQGFTISQTSAFFTAAHTLLCNIKEKHMHILDNINELREMLSGVGQPDAETPGGLDCFDTSHARTISEFFHKSLFQHYKLYQFVFSHTQAEEIIGLDLTCELILPADIPYPAPLDEGLTHDVWEKYVKTPPPTPLPESQFDDEASPTIVQEDESEQEMRLAAEADQIKREARAQQEAMSAEESALLSKLSAEEIQQVVQIVTKDTFKNLNAEMAAKLRERENTVLNRINKVHKVAST